MATTPVPLTFGVQVRQGGSCVVASLVVPSSLDLSQRPLFLSLSLSLFLSFLHTATIAAVGARLLDSAAQHVC